MKKLNVISMLMAAMILAGGFAANAGEKSTNLIRKAYFLSLSDYAKSETLKLQFGIADRNTRGFVYDNLQTTQPFALTSFKYSGVSFRNYSAARKAAMAYNLKTNKDVSRLAATVLFEKAEHSVNGEENPWAILLSMQTISALSNKVTYQSEALYIIDRDSTGEKLTKIQAGFDSPLL